MTAAFLRRRARGPAPIPALYLSAVQFVFLTCWTVYVIFLPGLLESVGIPRTRAPWILLTDQLLFAVFDVLMGFTADRAFRVYGRVAPWIIGLTAASCLAFLALPWISGDGNRGPATFVLLGAMFVWAVTSSALRSPAFAMLTRHVPAPRVPLVAGLALAGTGAAGALAPYLGLTLRGIDPRLPFALTSLSLFALTVGLVWAERSGRRTDSSSQKAGREQRPTPTTVSVWPALALVGAAALAYQVFFTLNAAPRYAQEASEDLLPWLIPVFQVGFSLAAATAGFLAARRGPMDLFAGGCLLAGAGAWAFALPGLAAALGGQLLAGLGWGAALAAAFGLARQLAGQRQPPANGTMTGLLFSMLALAAGARIAATIGGWGQEPAAELLLLLLPPLAWTAAGVTALAIQFKSGR
jgi:MFS family permease